MKNILVQKKLFEFFKDFKKIEFNKGDIIMHPSKDPKGIYFLASGVVKRYAISTSGDELILNTFKANTFFPVSWAINSTLTTHYFEAMTTCVTYKSPVTDFVKFLKSNNDVMYDLLSRIYVGLDGYMLKMEQLMSNKASNKLLVELFISAKRFGTQDGQKVVVDSNITEANLASQTGMTRETVSREIKKLKKIGLIDYSRHKLTILNLSKIEKIIFDSI